MEGGYRFVAPGVGFTPYAAGQFTTFELPNYAEQAVPGANTFALAYNGRSVTDPRSELGLRTDKSFAMVDGILTLRSRAAWAHDYTTDRFAGATFQALPGTSFVVKARAGPPIPLSSPHPPKENGSTAGRRRQPSKANSLTSPPLTPARAPSAKPGDISVGAAAPGSEALPGSYALQREARRGARCYHTLNADER